MGKTARKKFDILAMRYEIWII